MSLLTLLQTGGTPPSPTKKIWLKVSGTWKEATPYIKISGTWKIATPYINVSGTWK
jgi:hypothetical protein